MDVFVSLMLEQQELCRVRLKLLQFIDRLLTYQVCRTFFRSILYATSVVYHLVTLNVDSFPA